MLAYFYLSGFQECTLGLGLHKIYIIINYHINIGFNFVIVNDI